MSNDLRVAQSAKDLAPKVRKGSCLCRSVRYQVTGEPFTVRVCHCQNCKKATGGAFLTLGYFNDKVCILSDSLYAAFSLPPLCLGIQDINVTDGESHMHIFADQGTSSGVPLHRYFCSKCGSNLFLRSEIKNEGGRKIGIIAVGTIDDEENWSKLTLGL